MEMHCFYCGVKHVSGTVADMPWCMCCNGGPTNAAGIRAMCNLAYEFSLKAAQGGPNGNYGRRKAMDNGWIAHTGTKRPKGVGKRDTVEATVLCPAGWRNVAGYANELDWRGYVAGGVAHYRVVNRAPKAKRIWVVDLPAGLSAHENEDIARSVRDISGCKLYTAKLKEVE